MMLISWIVLAVVISLALSLCAVLWDALAGAAYQNERTRLWVRRVLLLEATDDLAGGVVDLAERLSNLPSGFRAFWQRNFPKFVRAVDLIVVALLATYEVHHYYFVERTIRPIDMLALVAIAVGIVAYFVAIGSETTRI